MFWVSSCVETARFDAIVVVELMVVDGMMLGLIKPHSRLRCHAQRVHMVAENGVALAKPNDLAIPHSIHGASIAL